MQAHTPRSLTTVRMALRLPFSAADVADYLFSPEVVGSWLGTRAVLRPEIDSVVFFPKGIIHSDQPAGSDKFSLGRVSALAWPVHKASGSSALPERKASPVASPFKLIVNLNDRTEVNQVSFRISPCERYQPKRSLRQRDLLHRRPPGARDYCLIRIAQSGLEGKIERDFAVKSWQSVINRIDRLMKALHRAKRRERQAIIVVHGIGEQRPGQMLSDFVENIFPEAAGEVHFLKPDYISSLFEMRTMTVRGDKKNRPTTDVYELYWAHLIRDTTLMQVYRWGLRLLLSNKSPNSIKIPLKLIRVAILLIIILAILNLVFRDVISSWIAGIGFGIFLIIPIIVKFFYWVLGNDFIIGYAGDAARYLDPYADNIASRQAIREAGAKILDDLHAKNRYARIIVYGHSLGGVIAYDILSHDWMRRARKHHKMHETRSRALVKLESILNQGESRHSNLTDDDIQSMQHAAWQEYRRNGFDWRVSDLVTTGSPLAHAEWLLNLSDFNNLKKKRFFPTCPPQTEGRNVPGLGGKPRLLQVFTFTHAYKDKNRPDAQCSVQVPHHAGLFALTRWTNLYFHYDGLLKGDPIAGPLKKPFGDWIKDVDLKTTRGFAHNRYTNRGEPASIEQVRSALNLSLHRPLADYQPCGE
ncbi:hypothetical protein [Malikia spinosa]|uniref:hypothetical protein n=1 Tax=Malikia spinosa TaxID=86180 RepID=UPI0011B05E42|nr:hypothetical protein [Malikia spinosa]